MTAKDGQSSGTTIPQAQADQRSVQECQKIV
eukprot:CAMPEP_0206546148 /NCGR_PEP_ID=MMETSP0325_2-20121206/12535_1 /ASSEMBLY_ACC=CAM_ASM_000347 /TAXON_ID=2866 /ORGANISM="Crypthecodinium cohnii, Strain Seligo" /LENGTH=30 /DNA_ID= /DNA_START= /DNA_END= /DNA_ORIENTATION=